MWPVRKRLICNVINVLFLSPTPVGIQAKCKQNSQVTSHIHFPYSITTFFNPFESRTFIIYDHLLVDYRKLLSVLCVITASVYI